MIPRKDHSFSTGIVQKVLHLEPLCASCFSVLFYFVSVRGDCATCEISLAGRRTKVCVAKVPPEPTLKSLKEKGLVITG
jgi:hypothetical protein